MTMRALNRKISDSLSAIIGPHPLIDGRSSDLTIYAPLHQSILSGFRGSDRN